MPIHIDEIQTEVEMQGERPAPQAAAAEAEWQRIAALRRQLMQLLADDARTRACGNED